MIDKPFNQRFVAAPDAQYPGVIHYWDKTRSIPAVKILPGQLYVTGKDEIITTVLGSCISVCLRDARAGIGGMNHFMLPESGNGEGFGDAENVAARYGINAMELLINDLMKNGCQKHRFEVKVFGGGEMMKGISKVGASNIRFIHDYLSAEGLGIASEDVGDIYPRKIVFFPRTGKVLQKKIRDMHNDTIVRREHDYQASISQQPATGDVELF